MLKQHISPDDALQALDQLIAAFEQMAGWRLQTGKPRARQRELLNEYVAAILARSGVTLTTNSTGPYADVIETIYRAHEAKPPSWRTWSKAVDAVNTGRVLWCDYEAYIRLFQSIGWGHAKESRLT